MHLIVLAAGFATRMYPLTKDQPKPLLEVAGRSILDRLIAQFAATGRVDGITIVTNHKFASHFETWRERSRSLAPSLRVDLVDDGVSEDTSNLGALRDLQLVLQGKAKSGWRDDFVVSGGDNIFAFPMEPFFDLFARTRATVLPVRSVQGALKPKTYGEVEFTPNGRVTRVREKSPDPKSRFAAFCLYFYPAAAALWLDEYLAAGGNHDAPGYFLEWLVPRQEVTALAIQGAWYDIGSAETLDRARRELSS